MSTPAIVTQFAASLRHEFGDVTFSDSLPRSLEAKSVHINKGDPFIEREGNKLVEKWLIVITAHKDTSESGFTFVRDCVLRMLPLCVAHGVQFVRTTGPRYRTMEPNTELVSAFIEVLMRYNQT